MRDQHVDAQTLAILAAASMMRLNREKRVPPPVEKEIQKLLHPPRSSSKIAKVTRQLRRQARTNEQLAQQIEKLDAESHLATKPEAKPVLEKA